MLIIRREQFGIFIYCNVILDSFFISNGWFLNENVEEELRHACVSGPCLALCVFARERKNPFLNVRRRVRRRKILHLIHIKCLTSLLAMRYPFCLNSNADRHKGKKQTQFQSEIKSNPGPDRANLNRSALQKKSLETNENPRISLTSVLSPSHCR